MRIDPDSNLGLQMKLKLEEYRKRLLQSNLDAHIETSTNYKIWVLQLLLSNESLNFETLKSKVTSEAENTSLSLAYLAYAWKVIENYIYALGDNNLGGTGLPELPWTFGATTPLGSPILPPN